MIVFDGDSVMSTEVHHLPVERGWPAIVAGNKPHLNLSSPEVTAAKCLTRLWRGIEAAPQWYILQLGQWSSTHEPLPDFERNLRLIIEELNERKINVCLVTPPAEMMPQFNTLPYVLAERKLSRIYKTLFIDLHEYTRNAIWDQWFIDDNARCHFHEKGHRMMAEFFNRSITL